MLMALAPSALLVGSLRRSSALQPMRPQLLIWEPVLPEHCWDKLVRRYYLGLWRDHLHISLVR